MIRWLWHAFRIRAARFYGWRAFRVIYDKDGARSQLMYYGAAKDYAAIFGGKVVYDPKWSKR